MPEGLMMPEPPQSLHRAFCLPCSHLVGGILEDNVLLGLVFNFYLPGSALLQVKILISLYTG